MRQPSRILLTLINELQRPHMLGQHVSNPKDRLAQRNVLIGTVGIERSAETGKGDNLSKRDSDLAKHWLCNLQVMTRTTHDLCANGSSHGINGGATYLREGTTGCTIGCW